MNKIEVDKIDVVVLCGGKGSRLQSVVSDRPKPMADMGNRPFLDILIDYVANFGFRRFILCISHMGSYIRKYYQDKEKVLEIIFSEESKSLGTAGAIKNAEHFIRSSSFLVINGDSFCQIDLKEFLKFYFDKNALCSMVLTERSERIDYGVVVLGESQRIINFGKKANNHKASFVNAGIYLFQKEILSFIPPNKSFSLEKDFFPEIVDRQFYGYVTQEVLIDIGTPERYKKARAIMKNIK